MEVFPIIRGKLAEDSILVFEKIQFKKMVHIPRDRKYRLSIFMNISSGGSTKGEFLLIFKKNYRKTGKTMAESKCPITSTGHIIIIEFHRPYYFELKKILILMNSLLEKTSRHQNPKYVQIIYCDK